MLKGFVSGEEKDIVRIPMKGKNLFDSSVYTSGYNIASDGGIVENSNYSLSGYIFVAAGTYTLSGKNTYNTTANIANRAILYDENKENPVIVLGATGAKPVDFEYTIQIPKSGFLVFAFRTTDINLMLNPGSTALPYEPYGYQEGWEVRDNQDRLIWGREDELQTATGTLPFKGYSLSLKVKSLLGNAVQNGTPAPDNIIMPEMCGVKTNLLSIPTVTRTLTYSGGNLTVSSSGGDSMTLTGNITELGDWMPEWEIWKSFDFTLDAGEYTLRLVGEREVQTAYGMYLKKYDTDESICLIGGGSIWSRTFTLTQRTHLYMSFYIRGHSMTNDKWTFMLNRGASEIPYGWKVPFENHGENLFDKVFTSGYHLSSYGNPTAYTNDARCATLEPIDVSGVSTVTFSFTNTIRSDTKKYMYSLFNGSTLVTRVSNQESGSTIDVSQGDKLYLCVYSSLTSVNAAETTIDIMLTLGSTPKPYSPYLNETIPVYLGEVPTVRRVKKLVLTGNEIAINKRTTPENSYSLSIGGNGWPAPTTGYGLSSHFVRNGTVANLINGEFYVGSTAFSIRLDDCADAANFRSYLAAQYQAGTPVTVWYIPSESETTISNEPLAKIGTYADELTTIQVHGLSTPLYGIGDYKDTLNLSTGVVTRKVKKLVLTGEENVDRYVHANTVGFAVENLLDANYNRAPGICSHYRVDTRGWISRLWIGVQNKTLYFVGIGDVLGIDTATEFKAWLTAQYQAGTPVTVWYVLSTPETETVTVPTGMTGEIEGYLTQVSTPTPTNRSVPKWNGVEETGGTYAVTVYAPPEIPTTTGENTMTVETDLAPSSLTVKGHIKEST